MLGGGEGTEVLPSAQGVYLSKVDSPPHLHRPARHGWIFSDLYGEGFPPCSSLWLSARFEKSEGSPFSPERRTRLSMSGFSMEGHLIGRVSTLCFFKVRDMSEVA